VQLDSTCPNYMLWVDTSHGGMTIYLQRSPKNGFSLVHESPEGRVPECRVSSSACAPAVQPIRVFGLSDRLGGLA